MVDLLRCFSRHPDNSVSSVGQITYPTLLWKRSLELCEGSLSADELDVTACVLDGLHRRARGAFGCPFWRHGTRCALAARQQVPPATSGREMGGDRAMGRAAQLGLSVDVTRSFEGFCFFSGSRQPSLCDGNRHVSLLGAHACFFISLCLLFASVGQASARTVASLSWTWFTSLLTHRLVLLCIDAHCFIFWDLPGDVLAAPESALGLDRCDTSLSLSLCPTPGYKLPVGLVITPTRYLLFKRADQYLVNV